MALAAICDMLETRTDVHTACEVPNLPLRGNTQLANPTQTMPKVRRSNDLRETGTRGCAGDAGFLEEKLKCSHHAANAKFGKVVESERIPAR